MILNRKATKERVFTILKDEGETKITRVGNDLLSLAEATLDDALRKLVRQALVQHRKGRATLGAPCSAGLPPTKRRKA